MSRRRETMKAEYDFSPGVRGKYAPRMRRASNVVRIEPDLAIEFPTEAAVNAALRELLRRRRSDTEGSP